MANQHATVGMQHALAVFALVVLSSDGYRLVAGAGWSWLTLSGIVGACVLVLAIYLVRPRWVVQVPLALSLIVWPSVVLTWQSGEWKSLIALAGMLFPLVVVFIAACFAVRGTRKSNPSPINTVKSPLA